MLNTVRSNVYVDVNNYHFHMILYLKYQYQSLYGLFLSEKSYTEGKNRERLYKQDNCRSAEYRGGMVKST